MTLTTPERLTALETKMEIVRETVAEIRKTQIEMRDTQLGDRAKVKGGWTALQLAYPPASAAIVWALAQWGFHAPLPK
jgi:hypothetical protein